MESVFCGGSLPVHSVSITGAQPWLLLADLLCCRESRVWYLWQRLYVLK